MSAEQPLETIASRHLDGFNRHDPAGISVLYGADGLWDCPPGTRSLRGSDAVGQYLSLVFHAFPDIAISQKRVMQGEGSFAIEWRAQATHERAFLGIRGTNRRMDIHGISIFEHMEQALVSHHYCDELHLLDQMGALPGSVRL